MVCLRRLLFPTAVFAVASVVGCAGPPIPAPIDGEPFCPSFESGRTKMEGSLRHPVRLRVLEGSTVVFRTMLTGKANAAERGPFSFIADSNEEYTVEWGLCANERAPKTVAAAARDRERKGRDPAGARAESTPYECGAVKVYKTEKLRTKRGDAASHVIAFQASPEVTCWTSDTAQGSEQDAGAAPVDGGEHAPTDSGVPGDGGGSLTDAAANADAGNPEASSDGGQARREKRSVR